MGHTDVVPVNADGWSRDPFGAEIVDGMVWGRGAVDMLNLTATMAVAFRRLADSGFKPKGTISYLAVADEEARDLGRGLAGRPRARRRQGRLRDHRVGRVPGADGPRPAPAGDGRGEGHLLVEAHGAGTPGHASSPYRTDNALVTAAEVVRRLAEFQAPPELSGTWQRLVQGLGLPDVLLQEEGFRETIDQLPLGLARIAYSCTHTTFAPTVVHGGTKTNVIPDRVDIEVDIRTLPGPER